MSKCVTALRWCSCSKKAILAFLVLSAFDWQVCNGQLSGTGLFGVTYTAQDVWSDGTYNAFTDLTRYDGDWYMVFRTASTHGIPPPDGPGGRIRVLKSADGQSWTTAALFGSSGVDYRDPKITVMPGNQLMITTGSFSQSGIQPLQSAAFFSSGGARWSTPAATGQYDYWTWRTVWHNGVGYGISYGPNNTDGANQAADDVTRLLTTTNGVNYSTLVSPLNAKGQCADEAGLTFLPDGTAVELVRRDWESTAGIGVSTAASNYTNWTFTSANMLLESPDLLTLPDGRIVAAGRAWYVSGQTKISTTELCWLDPKTSTLTPFLQLGYNSDTGYPGLYYDNNKLWVSYYSNISGRSDIYVAQVSIPAATWMAPFSGLWGTASNWGGAAPGGPGALVVMNAPTYAPVIVTLDTPQTVGTLQLGNSANANTGYVITGSGACTLTLNNSGSRATIAAANGTHVIDAPVVLADDLVMTGSGTVEFDSSSSISQVGSSRSLTMNAAGGTLILGGWNTFAGGTFVTAGTLDVTSANSLADGTSLTVGNLAAFANAASASAAGLPSQGGIAVPEPGTLVLLLAAIIAGSVSRRRAKLRLAVLARSSRRALRSLVCECDRR